MQSCADVEKIYLCKFIKRKRKRKIIKKIGVFSILFIFTIFLVINFVSKRINPVIYSYGEASISKILTESGNEAISNIAVSIAYDQLINIKYAQDGSISTIQANTEQINKISNILAQSTQNCINSSVSKGLSIPIGTLTGIGFLTGRGYKVKFNIDLIGNVLCHFHTSFSSAGINQTSHKIYVEIIAECFLNLPFESKIISKKLDYLLAESIIIGKIPETYLNVSSAKDFS